MAGKWIDCREHVRQMNCTAALAADTNEELMEIAVQHAVAATVTRIPPSFVRCCDTDQGGQPPERPKAA